ncbi:hypothetical protein TNCV_4564941 [Trichonephila clavipes]|nr:hypothetical protein TNCV_4564941 [Trichonephila clavipes]
MREGEVDLQLTERTERGDDSVFGSGNGANAEEAEQENVKFATPKSLRHLIICILPGVLSNSGPRFHQFTNKSATLSNKNTHCGEHQSTGASCILQEMGETVWVA